MSSNLTLGAILQKEQTLLLKQSKYIFLDLSKFTIIELSDGTTFNDNRSSYAINYTDINSFFENAKKCSVKELYTWKQSRTTLFYAFMDNNRILHKLQVPGDWSSLEELEKTTNAGFNSRYEFLKAKQHGFTKNTKEYGEFTNSGCQHKKDWLALKKSGFEDYVQFNAAKKVGAKTPQEMDELMESEFPDMNSKRKAFKKCKARSLTGYILFLTIEDLPSDVGVPIATLSQQYYARKRKYKTEGINTNDFHPDMLFKYPVVRDLGLHNKKLDLYFKGMTASPKVKITKISVVVDGNNVARNTPDGAPALKNIKLMIAKLKSKGVKKITFFLSQTTRNMGWGNDKDELESLIKKGTITMAPADGDDDYWHISLALEKGIALISCDKFRNWMESNPTESEKLWNLRVPFQIVDDTVLLAPPFGTLKNLH